MLMRTEQIRPLLIVALLLMGVMPALAQSAFSFVEGNRNFPAGEYAIYPENDLPQLTPAPEGYTPFYISHYGRHGSRYLNDIKGYMEPYKTLHEADSLGKLSAIGQMALQEIKQYIANAQGRWGDLSYKGQLQQRHISHRMSQNFPEVFSHGAFVDARSTIVTRCELSMGAAVLQLVKEHPDLSVTMNNSYSDMWYMNHQNKSLRDSAETNRTEKALNAFIKSRWFMVQKLNQLFNDTVYVHQNVDTVWLAYYLIKAALTQQNTERSNLPNPLLHFFSVNDLYRFWQVENAWSYIHSGFCELNDAKQPYMQACLLRKIIDEADSVIDNRQHGISLRFGHGTILLPLVCLMGINGYDYMTDDLESLEQKGWWASRVFPMAGNIQIVFYHKNTNDHNPLVKVLLNEKEAKLPLPSDLTPYYRWSDFRDYYLRKASEGESVLGIKR